MAAEDATPAASTAAPATMETDKPAEAGAEEEEEVKHVPCMEQAQRVYLLELAHAKPEFVADAAEVKAQVLAQVSESEAAGVHGRLMGGIWVLGVVEIGVDWWRRRCSFSLDGRHVNRRPHPPNLFNSILTPRTAPASQTNQSNRSRPSRRARCTRTSARSSGGRPTRRWWRN